MKANFSLGKACEGKSWGEAKFTEIMRERYKIKEKVVVQQRKRERRLEASDRRGG